MYDSGGGTMELINHFINGLHEHLLPEELEELQKSHGASAEDLEQLRRLYPDCPESLLYLLENIDGTFWRQYGEEKIAVCILGSDVEDGRYPYYLLSTQQMIDSSKEEVDTSYLSEYKEDDVDPRINQDGLYPGTYIHFSDCMNNGGTSSLFIDFNPTDQGVSGQIVRFLHDPDEFKVIAESFDEYVQGLIDGGFVFLEEEV